jgi:hypothetical protein
MPVNIDSPTFKQNIRHEIAEFIFELAYGEQTWQSIRLWQTLAAYRRELDRTDDGSPEYFQELATYEAMTILMLLKHIEDRAGTRAAGRVPDAADHGVATFLMILQKAFSVAHAKLAAIWPEPDLNSGRGLGEKIWWAFYDVPAYEATADAEAIRQFFAGGIAA